MNIKKSITWAVAGLFVFVSALSAEEIKGDKTAGKTDARRLAKSGMDDSGPTSTFFNINSWKIQMEHQGFFQWNGTSRTVLPVTTQRVWEVLFLLKVFCGA